jgi:hypothetical protein
MDSRGINLADSSRLESVQVLGNCPVSEVEKMLFSIVPKSGTRCAFPNDQYWSQLSMIVGF